MEETLLLEGFELSELAQQKLKIASENGCCRDCKFHNCYYIN